MDIYRKVNRGDPMRIPHQAYNQLLDLLPERRGRLITQPFSSGWPHETIWVMNNSGSDRDQFEILSVTDPLVSPTENELEFQRRVMVIGGTVTADDVFVVLVEPIKAGKIGRGVITGCVPVQVTGAAQTHASPSAGDPTQLTMDASGAARVVWADSGSGTRWAIVRLGDAAGGGGSGVGDYVSMYSTGHTTGTSLSAVTLDNFYTDGGSTFTDDTANRVRINENGLYLLEWYGLWNSPVANTSYQLSPAYYPDGIFSGYVRSVMGYNLSGASQGLYTAFLALVTTIGVSDTYVEYGMSASQTNASLGMTIAEFSGVKLRDVY